MPYFKDSKDNTCFLHEIKDGWVEISEEELTAIIASKQVQPEPQAIINAKLTTLREVREAILNRLGGIALAAQLTGDTATVTAYLAARKGLLDITKDLPADLHDIELAVFGRYQAIVSTAMRDAPALVSAFAGVDL